MSFVSLRAAIKAKLDILVTANKIKVAYDYLEENPSGFPAAMFEPSGNEGVIYTNADNLRSYNFDILLIQEFETDDRDFAVDNLTALVDEVIQTFEEDTNGTGSFGGACDFSRAINSSWNVANIGTGNVLIARLQLVCVKEVAVKS